MVEMMERVTGIPSPDHSGTLHLSIIYGTSRQGHIPYTQTSERCAVFLFMEHGLQPQRCYFKILPSHLSHVHDGTHCLSLSAVSVTLVYVTKCFCNVILATHQAAG